MAWPLACCGALAVWVSTAAAMYLDARPECKLINFTALGQRCLFFTDSDLANLRFASWTYTWPITNADSIEEMLANAEVVYDSASVLTVPSVGRYRGPPGIVEYQAITNPVLTNGLFDGNLSSVELATHEHGEGYLDMMRLNYMLSEKWKSADTAVERLWTASASFRPCGVVVGTFEKVLAFETMQAAENEALQPYMIPRVCDTVQTYCTGALRQFNSTEECLTYYKSLPVQDPVCKAKYGGASFKGETLMCKVIHHYMIASSPELHCWHSGPVLGADVRGAWKCSPKDCNAALQIKALSSSAARLDKGGSHSDCDEGLRVALETRTLLALPHCLSALAVGLCTENCSQALNTHVMPVADKLCGCVRRHPEPLSKMLEIMEVDARSLLSVCMFSEEHRDSLMGLKQSCVDQGRPKSVRCPDPNTYVSSSGCNVWAWDAFEGKYLESLTPEALQARFSSQGADDASYTSKQLIAGIDYLTYKILWGAHKSSGTNPFNLPEDYVLRRLAHRLGTRVAMVPGFEFDFSYPSVLTALQNPLTKKPYATKGDSWMPTWDIFFPTVAPMRWSSGTMMHEALRAANYALLPGLTDKTLYLPERLRIPEGSKEEDIFEALVHHFVPAIFGEGVVARLDPQDRDLGLSKVTRLGGISFMPNIVHEAFGYTISTALRTKQKQAQDKIREALGEEFLRSIAENPGFAGHPVSVDDVVHAVVTGVTNFGAHLLTLATNMVVALRRDPCRLRPLWEEDPKRFVFEYLRLNPKAAGQYVEADGTVRMYDVGVLNRDPSIFKDPDVFDPRRGDLNQAVTFNALEKDVENPPLAGAPDTTHRVCPGREFTIQFLLRIIPQTMPNAECYLEEEVFEGVRFRKELVRTAHGALELRKAVSSHEPSHLAVLVHGVPYAPQMWSPIIRKLQRLARRLAWVNSHWGYWALTLPEWEESTSREGPLCDFSISATKIIALLGVAKTRYSSVVLIGHDFGAILGYYVAHKLEVSEDDDGLLNGFVAIAGPHPLAADRIPASSPISVLFSPLWRAFFSANDFEVLAEDLNHTMSSAMVHAWKSFMERLGPARAACYHRQNFRFSHPFHFMAWSWHEEQRNVDNMVSEMPHLIIFPAAGKKANQVPLYRLSAKLFPAAELVQIENATHVSLLFDHADEVSEHIAEFLLSRSSENLSPLSYASYTTFKDIIALIWFLILVTAGYTLEFFTMRWMKLKGSLISLPHVMLHWQIAKTTFPLFVSCAVFSQSWLGAPLYLLGMWKCGFPETLAYFRLSGDVNIHRIYRFMNGFTGSAMTLHHLGSTLIYAFTVAGSLKLDRDLVSIGLVLVFIHVCWNLLLFKRLKHLAVFLMFAAELWFELESLVVMQRLETPASVGVCMLLASHWACMAVMSASVVLTRKPMATFYLPPTMEGMADVEVMRYAMQR